MPISRPLGALGSAGFSAAGVSSGLGALGTLGGGGMLAGVTVAAAIPLFAATLFGLFALYFSRWLDSRELRASA